jgi:hypothetical protein
VEFRGGSDNHHRPLHGPGQSRLAASGDQKARNLKTNTTVCFFDLQAIIAASFSVDGMAKRLALSFSAVVLRQEHSSGQIGIA